LGLVVRGIVSARSAKIEPGFVIDDLHPRDADGADQAAALLVAAFPHRTPMKASAREVVAQALAPGNICLAARERAEILGWVGILPEYSHAWELHPLVMREDVRGRGTGWRW
jgi:aminoglycoside 6'-N-acetyltransferase I